jgi:hypothetical protein
MIHFKLTNQENLLILASFKLNKKELTILLVNSRGKTDSLLSKGT